MNILNRVKEQQTAIINKVAYTIPTFSTGDVIRVRITFSKQDRRRQAFTGMCIARTNRGACSTFRLVNIVYGQLVYKSFPLYSKLVSSIQLLPTTASSSQRKKQYRSKLYQFMPRRPYS